MCRRDDIIANHRRTIWRRVKKNEELEAMLSQMANMMTIVTADTMQRVHELSGYSAARTDAGAIGKARALVASAQSARRLSQQDPTFHPWL
jgi:hypothetical protein